VDNAWTVHARERLEERFCRALTEVARRCEDRGKLDEAADWYPFGIERAPLSEALYRGLIQCHLDRGETAAGVRAYRIAGPGPALPCHSGAWPLEDLERIRRAGRTPVPHSGDNSMSRKAKKDSPCTRSNLNSQLAPESACTTKSNGRDLGGSGPPSGQSIVIAVSNEPSMSNLRSNPNLSDDLLSLIIVNAAAGSATTGKSRSRTGQAPESLMNTSTVSENGVSEQFTSGSAIVNGTLHPPELSSVSVSAKTEVCA